MSEREWVCDFVYKRLVFGDCVCVTACVTVSVCV